MYLHCATIAATGCYAACLRGAVAATKPRAFIRNRLRWQLVCVERCSGTNITIHFFAGNTILFAGNTIPSTDDGNQNQFAKQID
jgi:hypothetical protein